LDFCSWWSVWEQDCQILRLWPGLCTWFIEDQDLDTKSAAALAAMLSALEVSARLYLQLAVSVHFCKPWVQFTYKFEADTFQADLVYDALQDLTRRVQGDVSQLVAILRCLCSIFFFPWFVSEFGERGSESIPELDTEFQRLAAGSAPELASCRQVASAILKPALEWWQSGVMGPAGHLKDDLPFYFNCRFISPTFASTHAADTCISMVEALGTPATPLFTSHEVTRIKDEQESFRQDLVGYALANDARSTLEWWKPRSHRFPAMVMALKKIACLNQTSASCERVFSILEQVLTSQQESQALGDYIEVYLMARYNRDWPFG